MTPQQIEAMKMALDLATMHHTDDGYAALREKVRSASKEALAQPEQEPVAWATREDFYRELDRSVNRMRQQMEIKKVVMRCSDYDIALPVIDIREGHVLVGQVTTPPQRTWAGLTNDEVNNFAAGCHLGKSVQGAIYEAEAKLKEKNT